MKNKRLVLTRPFEKSFLKLPAHVREATYEKLSFFQKDPSHPSLRVKKIKGTGFLWEMSVTMNYRITFQVGDSTILLRNIGTHDLLRKESKDH